MDSELYYSFSNYLNWFNVIIVYIMPILIQYDFKRHECLGLNYEVRQTVPVVYGAFSACFV